jgi:sugar lactone lactonase YvrE
LKNLSRCIVFITILTILFLPGISNSIECIESSFLFDIKPGADQPSDIAICPKGYIYLVDGVNNRIIVVTAKGKLKFTFGKKGAGNGEFLHPMGIDISKNGTVFIADSGNNRIQAFDSTGKYLYKFAVNSGKDEHPSNPVDVLALNFKNHLYVSDNANHSIKVYDHKGSFKFEWGGFGEGQGKFRYPGILAANSYNEVFVVDVLNTRVQKFDPFGNFISNIGSWGVAPGKLFRPKGVTVDKHKRVFVSDSYMGVIQVFTDLGRFIGVVCENNKKRQFTTPVGLVMDEKKDRLHVVEMRSNKISVVKIKK